MGGKAAKLRLHSIPPHLPPVFLSLFAQPVNPDVKCARGGLDFLRFIHTTKLKNAGLSLDEKFGCGWCQSSGKCEVKDKCGNDASSWLNRDQTCPNPQVTSFEPMLGPWEGNSIHSF